MEEFYTLEEQKQINEILAYLEEEKSRKDTTTFDGKLTTEEILKLMQAGVTTTEIMQIEEFLTKYKDSLTSFIDVVGDDFIPTKQFYFNIKHIAHLLDNDPNKVLSRFGVLARNLTTARLVKALAPNFMNSKQIIESKNKMLLSKEDWLNNTPVLKDKKIVLPKEPVLWISNHHFKDDALASVRVARPVHIVFGSIPLYFNTFDGILTYLIGALLVNRKSENSRHATPEKIKKAIDYKSDILWYVEGVHNKTPNQLTIEFWEKFYDIAIEKNVKVMTISHYIKDPTQKIPKEENPIHTIVDGPFDLTQFSKKEGVAFVRDNISSWYMLMAEKFGDMTREDLLAYYQNRAIEIYGAKKEDFEKRLISSHEAFEIYCKDYKTTVTGYDSTIEAKNADYRDKENIRPEDAYSAIAKLNSTNKNVWDVLEAQELVRTRKREDYQRRF